MKYEFLSEFTDKKNPTPSYIFDLDLLASHVQKIKELLKGRARICYAMKANPFLTRPMKELVDLFEVCSPGEFRICERADVPMEQIVLPVCIKIRQISGMFWKAMAEKVFIQWNPGNI